MPPAWFIIALIFIVFICVLPMIDDARMRRYLRKMAEGDAELERIRKRERIYNKYGV